MKLETSWYQQLQEEIAKDYIQQLKEFILHEKAENRIIYPPEPLVLTPFYTPPFLKLKSLLSGKIPITDQARRMV